MYSQTIHVVSQGLSAEELQTSTASSQHRKTGRDNAGRQDQKHTQLLSHRCVESLEFVKHRTRERCRERRRWRSTSGLWGRGHCTVHSSSSMGRVKVMSSPRPAPLAAPTVNSLGRWREREARSSGLRVMVAENKSFCNGSWGVISEAVVREEEGERCLTWRKKTVNSTGPYPPWQAYYPRICSLGPATHEVNAGSGNSYGCKKMSVTCCHLRLWWDVLETLIGPVTQVGLETLVGPVTLVEHVQHSITGT